MTMVQPRRLQLTGEQLAAALALAGLRPTSRANLPALPAPGRSDRALKSAGLLSEDGGLAPDVARALETVADPVQIMVVLTNRAGEVGWAQTTIARGGADQPFVVQAYADASFDFAILRTATEATVVVDELLDLTAFGSGTATTPADLDIAAFAALMAAADAVQEARLGAWLDRVTDLPEVVLTAPVLEDQLARGLAGRDTRWAVTAAMVAAPGGLAGAAGRMKDGLGGLAAAELVARAPGGFALTDDGREVAFGFGKLVTTGSLSLALAAPGAPAAIAHLSVFRTPGAIWMAAWNGLATGEPRVRVWSVPVDVAVRIVRGFVEPPTTAAPVPTPAPARPAPAPSRPAPAPSRPTPARSQPAPVSTPAPAPAPQPADAAAGRTVSRTARTRAPRPPAAAWAPTHVVPAAGMSAWSEPDPDVEPVARLDPRLEVQVTDTNGAWAHIVCSNGWAAWVDGRTLEPA